MSGDLVALAERYVNLSGELNEVRDAMKRLLLNGAGPPEKTPPGEVKPNPQPPRVRAKRARSKPHPNAIKFAETSETILTELRLKPSSTKEIAALTQAKTSTTVERLKKMKARGLVQRDDQGLYSAV